LLVFNMVRVIVGEYRAQDAHYGFYRDDLPSGDVIIIRRKVGEPTDYLHPNSRKVRQQRLNFGLASTHYSHLTPIQKRELRYVGEIVPFSRGRSKSDTKFLQGRTLFISKDIHALNETQRQIPTPLQICIVLTDQNLNPLEGDLWLYYLEDGEWKETTRRLLSPAYWLFPEVPSGKELYHPIGAAYPYYDPQDPETTYLTQKELMLYHYHPMSLLLPFSVGAPPMDRPGQYGNVVGVTRYLINLTNPAPHAASIFQVSAYFATASPDRTGYLVTFQETAPGLFSSRDFVEVPFPASTGLYSWTGLALDIHAGDFIGIGLPEAVGAPDYGIDCDSKFGEGVRHNQAGLTLPIVNQPFALYPDNIMSLVGMFAP